MDHQKFDNWIKGFGAEKSRRSLFAKMAQGGFAAALAAVGISQGTVVEEADAAQLEADANQKKCRRRCQKTFRRRRKRGVEVNKLRKQRRRCFRRCRPTPQPVPVTCSIDAQCATGRICEDGVCVTQTCETGADCGDNRVCDDGVCTVQTCTLLTDCDLLSTCQSGVCVTVGACAGDDNCDDGQTCVLGTCAPPTLPCLAGVCVTGDCVDGLCVETCRSTGISCESSSECCGGLACVGVLGLNICI